MKIWPFLRAKKLQLPGHVWSADHGLHTPALAFWKNVYHCPYLNTTARELLGLTATQTPSERVFSVVATMLCRPEPTKNRVEPTALGIAAIKIQLDQVHSPLDVMTST